MIPMARSTILDMASSNNNVPILTDNNLMVVIKVTVSRVAMVATRDSNPMEDLQDKNQADMDMDKDLADTDTDKDQADTDMVARDQVAIVQAVQDTMDMASNQLNDTAADMVAIPKGSTANLAATERILAREPVATDLESKAESVQDLILLEDNILTSAMMAETIEEEEQELAKFIKTNLASPHTVLSTTERLAINALPLMLAEASRPEHPCLTAKSMAHNRKLAHTVARFSSLTLNLETLAQELACLSILQTSPSRAQLFPAQVVVLTQILVVFMLPELSLPLDAKALVSTSTLPK